MNRRHFLLSSIVFFSGCTAVSRYKDLPPDKSGIVFASIAADEGWPRGAWFRVGCRSLARLDERFSLSFHKSALVGGDFTDGSLEGSVDFVRLPPGPYEVTGAEVAMGGAYLSRHIFNKDPISVPFEIEAGKATYLGEYAAYPRSVARALFFKLTSGLTYTVRNRLERDLKLLAERDQRVSPEQVRTVLMTRAQAEKSIFEPVD